VPPAAAFRAHQRVTVTLSAERVHLFHRGAHGTAIL